uniref:IREH1/IRE-like N-terminal domain-containing protein n=2 Tax=Aegilops tauschii TaxID=37682 RepID=A0A453JJY5_AEGTS
FSHELNPGGAAAHQHHLAARNRPRGEDEFIGAVKSKFIRLKEEVDCELGVFAGDLVGLLERATADEEDQQYWRVTLEDLLVVTQKCAEMSPEEFWVKCEGIVQALDDRRQELTTAGGALKQAHTRILFILTRCTRLLQFRKELSGYCGDADGKHQHMLGLHQLSDLGLYPLQSTNGGSTDLGRRSTSSLTELKERLIRRRMLEHKHLTLDFAGRHFLGDAGDSPGSGSSGKISSWKKLPSPARHKNSEAKEDKITPTKKAITRNKVDVDEIVERIDAASIHPDGLASLGDSAVKIEISPEYPGAQQIIVDGKPRMICRICDFEIPMSCAEGHFIACTLADRCDSKGLSTDKRLQRVAEVLERVLACFDAKSPHNAEFHHPENTRASTSSLTEESDGSMDHDNDLSHLLTVPSSELFSEGALTHASGNLSQSPLLTPRTSHEESQLTKHKAFVELENFQQVESLLTIARGIESIKSSEYSSLEDLSSYLEDLNAVIDTRNVDALVVETFGRRIAKLLQ